MADLCILLDIPRDLAERRRAAPTGATAGVSPDRNRSRGTGVPPKESTRASARSLRTIPGAGRPRRVRAAASGGRCGARSRTGAPRHRRLPVTAAEDSVRAPVLDRVKGQPAAMELLRGALRAPVHAYLFIGRLAAAALTPRLRSPPRSCASAGAAASARRARSARAQASRSPVVERVAPQSRSTGARSRAACPAHARPPVQVLVLVDFHLVDDAAPALLKTIEEPPDTTVIIITAETVPSPFVTIASRCMQVQFRPLRDEAIVEV